MQNAALLEARGRTTIEIAVVLPSTQLVSEPNRIDVHFDDNEDHGVAFNIELVIPAMEGLYWVIVQCAGRVLTQVPLRVIYLRGPSRAGA